MNDNDRIRLATPSGGMMLGPIERERCSRHRRRWVLFRWVWEVDGEISSANPRVERGCAECAQEDL